MPEYTRENTLRIAKRFHNRKRTYLLVNPLQAKHIPVSPTRALEMMDALVHYRACGLIQSIADN